MFRLKLLLCSFVVLWFFTNAQSQSKTGVVKKNKYTYEVYSQIKFKTDVTKKLLNFCWDVRNIKHLLTNQPASIKYSEQNGVQTLSYDYKVWFMNYFSAYERIKQTDKNTIKFKLIKSEWSVPFIPNLIESYGNYTVKYDGENTVLKYFQYSKIDSRLNNYYLNYIKENIEWFFANFEIEFLKTLKNADN